jgi:hypothetical protein
MREDNLAENAGRILARSTKCVKGILSAVLCLLFVVRCRQCYQGIHIENYGQRTTNNESINPLLTPTELHDIVLAHAIHRLAFRNARSAGWNRWEPVA